MWPPHALVIAEEKLLGYLLVRRVFDDKSKYLAKAGFTLTNPQALETAIRELASTVAAQQDGENDYGMVHFVTLKPGKER